MRKVSLTRNERAFLATCALSGSASLKELASLAGMREHAVRYAMSSLLERGAIKPCWQIDPFTLGLHGIAAYFNRGAESSRGRLTLERKLVSHPQVTWLAKMAGSYQYGIAFNTRRIYDLDDFFALLRPSEPAAHFEKTVRIALDWSLYTPNYLAPSGSKRQVLSMTPPRESINIDETDAAIVRTMASYPHESLPQIARRLSMGSSSFSYRFDKLRDRKIIRGLTYVQQTEKLGISTFRIFIVERGLSSEQKETFKDFLFACPHVVSCVRCAGSWDYELRFETETPEDLDAFCQKLYDTFGSGIGSLSICQQFRTLKWLSVPLI
jgi:DNA-binding Lrp family transcriptional regulator